MRHKTVKNSKLICTKLKLNFQKVAPDFPKTKAESPMKKKANFQRARLSCE